MTNNCLTSAFTRPLAWAGLVVLSLGTPVGAQSAAGSLTVLDAARMTVAAQPEIKLQEQQVVFSESTLQAAHGQFDPQLRTAFFRGRDVLPLTSAQIRQSAGLFDDNVTHTTFYRAELSKQLRNGLELAWTALVSGDAALATALNASLGGGSPTQ